MSSSRLLVVDDDPLIVATLSQGLRDAGYEVLEVRGGREAIEQAGRGSVDLAILDVGMPEMSGIEVAQWLRANTGIPFMFLSAYGEQEIVGQAVREGALSYLVKPVDVDQVAPVVEAALSRAGEIRQLRETEEQLTTALAGNRAISMAVGVVMERYRLSEREAFERLRSHARGQQRKLASIAREILDAVETSNMTAHSAGSDKAE
jgi:AmiR/NasT family two-component response regulator